mgnify:CR=1 FL=1
MSKWLDNAIFYEIYPQSFNDTNGDGIGDFNGIIEKLDYIKKLGCNAIWINPCFESPFGDAGYDVSDYCKAAPRYGTNEDLKHLFDEAHKRDMHVLLDLVPGHTSVQHEWFKQSMKAEKNEFTDRYVWTDNVWVQPEGYGTIRGISDRNGSITVESVADGVKIYDNPVGVLTNNPPFPQQMFNLNNYMGLSPKSPKNSFSDKLELNMYSRGMGAMGLPGDLSSQSRFVRAAFTKMNSQSGSSESESISQFFHILGSVDQQRGCCEVAEGKYEITIYTSCCNADKGIYYYTTYENSQVTGVDMNKESLDSDSLIIYPLINGQQIKMMN